MNHVEMNMRSDTVWPPECNVPASWAAINGTLLFKRLPSEDQIYKMALDISTRFARLRSVAREDGEWDPLEPTALDLKYHVCFEPAVGGLSELPEAIDRIGR